ncbi:unnamed protein product, partial [Sphacelaria rigidula]
VGSLTCNYCGGHPLLLSTAPSRTPSKRRNVLFSQAVERVEEENDVFCDAQESEGQGSQVVTPQNQEGEPKAQQTGQHEPEKAAQSQVHPQREAATQLGTRERGGRGNSGMEWCA